jgi:chromosome segregation ATPase
MRLHLLKLSLAVVLAASLGLPALAAKKDKTKGLPPASSNNIPDVDDKPMKDAKVKLAQAQGQVERAQDTLNKLIAELRKQSEASPQLSAAQEALRQAQADYDNAAAPVLEKVRAGNAYRDALDAKKAAAQKVQDLQADPNADQDQITAAARVVLEKGHAVTEMENAALVADPKIVVLKEKLAAANSNLLKLKRDLEQSIKTNPQVLEARKQVEQAQQQVPPLQAAYNSESEKYNKAVANREKALNAADAASNNYNRGNEGGKGYNKRMMKKSGA